MPVFGIILSPIGFHLRWQKKLKIISSLILSHDIQGLKKRVTLEAAQHKSIFTINAVSIFPNLF
jgi:hypothetical protein